MAAVQKELSKGNNAKNVQKVQNEENTSELDLTEFLYRVWDMKWLVIILAVLGAVVMGLYTNYTSKKNPKYQSQSILYIGNNDSSVLSMSDLQIGASLTKDYTYVFQLPELRELAAQKLNGGKGGKLKGSMSVSNPSSTRMLVIKVVANDPEDSMQIAQAYAEAAKEIVNTKMKAATDMVILSNARKGSRVSAHVTRSVFIGLAAGILLALVIITIQFLTDTKIKTENDIRRYVDLPVLAVVPVMRGNGDKKGKGREVRNNPKKKQREQ